MISLGIGGVGGGGGIEEVARSTDAEGTSTTVGFDFLLDNACAFSSDNVSFGADGCVGATDIEETLPRVDFLFLIADACGFNSTNVDFTTDGCVGFGDANDTASEIGERANRFGFFFLLDCADNSANVGLDLDNDLSFCPITLAPKIRGLVDTTCLIPSSSFIPGRCGESSITFELTKEESSS